VRILTAHRILIGTFVVFSLFFGGWQLNQWTKGGGAVALAMGALSWIVAGGFGLYLWSLRDKTSL